MKITGNAKAALEKIQTVICSQHDHLGKLAIGKESKREAMFSSFFPQMPSLVVLYGHRKNGAFIEMEGIRGQI